MSGPYDDIINLPRPTSSGHPRMPICDRAFIFSPFAALAGHGAAIVGPSGGRNSAWNWTRTPRRRLDRRQAVLLEHLNEQPEITVTWFRPDERKEGGAYRTATGRLKKFKELERILVLADGTEIPLEDVAALESDIFQMLIYKLTTEGSTAYQSPCSLLRPDQIRRRAPEKESPMNIRKPTDYSAMYGILDQLMGAEFPQMELYF